MAAIGHAAEAAVGDLVEVTGRRVGERRRVGEIIEVLGNRDHRRFLVRWDDGHTTTFYPGEATTFRKASKPRSGRTKKAEVSAAPAAELIRFLRETEVEFEVLPHRRTLTASGEARALGAVAQTVAKTLVVRDEEGACIRAIVPATSRLDLGAVAAAVGATKVRLLSESGLVSAYPQFELGAVPPFGGPAGDRVVFDRELAGRDHIIVEAGVHDTSLRIRTDDLLELTAAQVADIGT